MIRLEPNITLDDIQQWLNDGWFYYSPTPVNTVPETDEGLLVASMYQWPGLDPSLKGGGKAFRVMAIDPETGSQTEHTGVNSEKQIFPHWPTCGSINIPSLRCAVHVRRLQKKQWRRTYNYRCLEPSIPKRVYIQRAVPVLTHPSLLNMREVIHAVFRPFYPPQDMIAAYFNSAQAWYSLALDSHTIITNTDPYLLYYNGQLAGKLLDDMLVPVNLRLADQVARKYKGERFV